MIIWQAYFLCFLAGVVVCDGCNIPHKEKCWEKMVAQRDIATDQLSAHESYNTAFCGVIEKFTECVAPTLVGCPADVIDEERDYVKYTRDHYSCTATLTIPGDTGEVTDNTIESTTARPASATSIGRTDVVYMLVVAALCALASAILIVNP